MDIYTSIFFKVPYHCLFRNQIIKEREVKLLGKEI